MKKRIIPLLLSLALLICFFPSGALADTLSGEVFGIAMGKNHALLINGADKAVWASGQNSYGQCGDTTKVVTQWHKVAGLTDVDKVFAGSEVSFAIKSDGSVWYWGGLPNQGLLKTTTPTPVPGLDGVVIKDVAASDMKAVFLDDSSNVWEIGMVYSDQVDPDQMKPIPTLIKTATKVQGVPSIKAVHTQVFFTVALAVDDSLWYWGHSNIGPLGSTPIQKPTKLDNTGRVLDVALTINRLLILDDNGKLKQWNVLGKKADLVKEFETKTFTDIATASVSTKYAAIEGSTVFNTSATLPSSSISKDFSTLTTPLSPKVALVNEHGSLILLNNGSLWAFGIGPRGLGSATNYAEFTEIYAPQP